MNGARPVTTGSVGFARACGPAVAFALALSLPALALSGSALAADSGPAGFGLGGTPSTQTLENVGLPTPGPDDRMLVESDQLVYDYDNNTVSAVGNVVIYYGGYTLEADRVSYDQGNGRLIASGAVEMTEPSGTTLRSDYIDITDDFADGFVQSLSVETTERTIFDAERAERSDGETVFINGSYSACVACAQTPDKPPFWKIRAKRIIINQEDQVVRFEDPTFEFFGTPIAWLPYFQIADPSLKRKSGLLAPHFGYSGRLGGHVGLPYFWAGAPNYDLTVTPTYYSRQGLMGHAEWRHRTLNGQYSIVAAGIRQQDKGAFDVDSASYREWRGGVRTAGQFSLSPHWTMGWDGTLSTDKTFTRDYQVLNGDTSHTTSTAFLEGVYERDHAELRASHYTILSDPIPADPIYDQGRQATAVPVFDARLVRDDNHFGGEFTYTSNVTSLYREDDDPFAASGGPYYHGTMGTAFRATKEVAWKKRHITYGGAVVQSFAYARADAFYLGDSGSAALGDGMTSDSYAFRAMPAVGVDVSLPILVSGGRSEHIIEPRAQLVVRPNEMLAGELPNNDAQSLVFDDTTLFDLDKFSGFDRTEGGTRLNLGVQYSSHFGYGGSVRGTFGQSFHLAGTNPYASPDLANVGPGSGLEADVSDFVAGAEVDTGFGPRFHLRGRFDHKTFDLERGEFGATTAFGPVTTSTSYVFLSSNPNTGVTSDSSVIRTAASVNLLDNWRAFGTVTYDVTNASVASDSFGIAYDDESATVSLAYSETRENYTDLTDSRWLSLRIQLRTIGETGVSTDLNRLSD